MFFNRRRKWNSAVADLLPNLGLDINEVGVFKSLNALDMIYPKGVSAEEGALFLAYASYKNLLVADPGKTATVKAKMVEVEEAWMATRRVNPENVRAWRQMIAKFE